MSAAQSAGSSNLGKKGGIGREANKMLVWLVNRMGNNSMKIITLLK